MENIDQYFYIAEAFMMFLLAITSITPTPHDDNIAGRVKGLLEKSKPLVVPIAKILKKIRKLRKR